MNTSFFRITTGMMFAMGAAVGVTNAQGLVTDNIVQTAANTPELSTLVTAVQTAGLDTPLSGTNEFTVFAPTNAAFAELGEMVDMLLLPENNAALEDLLEYHVVPGSVMAADLQDGMMVETLNGQEIEVAILEDGTVMVNDAVVVMPDVMTSNGVVHVVDTVLLPLPDEMMQDEAAVEAMEMQEQAETTMDPQAVMTVVDVATQSQEFTALVDSLDSQGLTEVLRGEGPFTVFAPANRAFERIPNIYVRGLTANPELLADVLLSHVVEGEFLAADVLPKSRVGNMANGTLSIGMRNGAPYVNGAQIIQPDILTDNGVIHVVDRLVLPTNVKRQLIQAARQ